jgi:hypothetical protein
MRAHENHLTNVIGDQAIELRDGCIHQLQAAPHTVRTSRPVAPQSARRAREAPAPDLQRPSDCPCIPFGAALPESFSEHYVDIQGTTLRRGYIDSQLPHEASTLAPSSPEPFARCRRDTVWSDPL